MLGFEATKLKAVIPQGKIWLNSPPLTAVDLADKAWLVDFWTYSCVNCLRTIPHLQKWWEEYRGQGLVIIGVHTPEFSFEKDKDNVALACQQLGITWPVVLDNDYRNWQAYHNRYWPSKYLIDRQGKIAYSHFGEGNYQETEMAIQGALMEANRRFVPHLAAADNSELGAVCFRPTPEKYCGYARGHLINGENIAEDQEQDYDLPDELPPDSLGLSGRFIVTREYVQPVQPEAMVKLQFTATEVNVVLHPVGSEGVVKVLLNGQNVPAPARGADLDAAGQLKLDRPRMYNLLRSREGMTATLSLQPAQGSFQCYAFTFSGCV